MRRCRREVFAALAFAGLVAAGCSGGGSVDEEACRRATIEADRAVTAARNADGIEEQRRTLDAAAPLVEAAREACGVDEP